MVQFSPVSTQSNRISIGTFQKPNSEKAAKSQASKYGLVKSSLCVNAFLLTVLEASVKLCNPKLHLITMLKPANRSENHLNQEVKGKKPVDKSAISGNNWGGKIHPKDVMSKLLVKEVT